MTIRAVIYDFDGTLIDSAESSFQCYVETFGRFGVPFDQEIFERTYSPNWLHTYAAVGLPRDKWDEANDVWLDLYSRIDCRLIAGVSAAMMRLAQAGVRQGIVTSGNRSRVERELRALAIESLFAAVVCSEDVTRKKPHPEGLLQALRSLNVEPADAVYVGDSPEDVQMARAAGVFSVAIPGKFPNRELLRASGANLHADSLEAWVRTTWAADAKAETFGPNREPNDQ